MIWFIGIIGSLVALGFYIDRKEEEQRWKKRRDDGHPSLGSPTDWEDIEKYRAKKDAEAWNRVKEKYK